MEFSFDATKRIVAARGTLVRDFNSEVAACKAWIRVYLEKRVGFNRSYTSYSYKHAVERWRFLNSTVPRDCYVSNEAFIVAAKELGFSATPTSLDSPNYYYRASVPRKLKDESGLTSRHLDC